MPRLSYTPGDYDLRVGRSATGLGIFAEQDIPKGACLYEYVGPQLTKEQEEKSKSKYLFEINARKTIDGTVRWNTARYINHSCRPNCEPNIYKARVYIHAKRKIKAGEELNYDYGKAYFDQFLKDICACPKCAEKKAAKRAAASRVRAKTVTKAAKKTSATKKAKKTKKRA